MGYPGISTKTDKNGVKNIYARFKHQGKIYPVKNLTKLFGVRTEKQGFDRVQEIKLLISQGKDPFVTSPTSLSEIFDDYKERMVASGVWGGQTPYNYTKFFDKHLRNTIGHKKIEKITYSDLLTIQERIEHQGNSTKNIPKMILRPIFNEAMKKGIIHKNVVLDLKSYKKDVKEPLDLRLKENLSTTIKKLYKTVPLYITGKKNQRDEIKYYLYFMILTGVRYGEILLYEKKHCHMDQNMILVPAAITKTSEDYKVPIPDECVDYFNSIEEGLIFPNIKRNGVYSMFKKFTKLAGVELFEGKVISGHDLRKFLLTIMISELKIDSVLADTCLNHKISGVKRHYINFSYEDRLEAFHKYWKYIRN